MWAVRRKCLLISVGCVFSWVIKGGVPVEIQSLALRSLQLISNSTECRVIAEGLLSCNNLLSFLHYFVFCVNLSFVFLPCCASVSVFCPSLSPSLPPVTFLSSIMFSWISFDCYHWSSFRFSFCRGRCSSQSADGSLVEECQHCFCTQPTSATAFWRIKDKRGNLFIID